MRKRILGLLLALVLTVCVLGIGTAQAETVYTEGTLYYTIANESITITGCFGRDAEVTVPAMIAGIPVNTIASGAFTENKNVQVLRLPDTISRVEPNAIGGWIKVIYNANTDHPQDTPTDLILLNMDADQLVEWAMATATPEATPEPVAEATPEPTPASTAAPTEQQSSGTADLDTTAQPTQASATTAAATAKPSSSNATKAPEPTTQIGETDVDLTELENSTPEPTEAPTAEATAEPSVEATAEPSAEASVTEEPVVTAQPTAEPDKTVPVTEPETPKRPVWPWVLGGVLAAALAAAVIVLVRKKGTK